MSQLREGQLRAGDLTIAYLEAGSAGAPLALCLHGFPDTPRTWRHLLPSLASVGWRAVAPWLRGYAPTEIPADGRYDLPVLARDALALMDGLGARTCVLIGSDWGALIGYGAAILAPQRVRRLVTLAVPHRVLGMAFTTSYDQLRRSWYTFFFQSPLADAALPAADFTFLDRLWADWSPGFVQPPEEREAMKRCFRTPGVAAAALGYYRAALGPAARDPSLAAEQMRLVAAEVPVPALYLHGSEDGCVGVEITRGMEAAFPAGLRKVVVDGTGHFLHLERPRLVNDAILDFLGAPQP
jgi:pimeloyl-ACP methyl ester carboxylesterase